MTDRESGSSVDTGDTIDRALRALGEPIEAPPIPAMLEAELDKLEPVATRSPRVQAAIAGGLSLAYVSVLVASLELRPDLDGLSMAWLILYCAAWLIAFGGLGWLALVPPARRVMPNWRLAGIGAVAAGIAFVAAGLLFHDHAPGASQLIPAELGAQADKAQGCVAWGLLTALVPVALGALLIRGTVPVGSRWVGAALGAAGGSLGGFMLHLHCHIADGLHLGIVHGGVVVLAAVVGALVIPRTSG